MSISRLARAAYETETLNDSVLWAHVTEAANILGADLNAKDEVNTYIYTFLFDYSSLQLLIEWSCSYDLCHSCKIQGI